MMSRVISWLLGVPCVIVGVPGTHPLAAQLGEATSRPQRVESVTVRLDADLSFPFRWIPPGTYQRGSPESEPGRDRDEGPRHRVILTRGFYLGTYEVTQAQWLAVMGENPAVFQQGEDHLRRPVESVSWEDCQRFLQRLNQRGRGLFRLPTEAEWEYACRAGTPTRYYWGDALEDYQTHPHAWANSRSMATTHPVGTKPANPWGLFDMSGSVWEWCQDWYGPYSAEEQTDPTGPSAGTEKIFRGGSWYDFPVSLRSSNRHRHRTDGRYTAIGLRLVWEPGP
jgi:formylglycine-generating enzyme required for sulfatase activity